MLKLDQWVPSSVCLKCQGCCRYARHSGVWAPFFLYEEIMELVRGNIVPCSVFSHPDVAKGRGGRIQTENRGEYFYCPCFDVKRNACAIYARRPLDCQLYPFLLARKEGKAFLAVDKKCPHVARNRSDPSWPVYVDYLFSSLESDTFLRQARNDPGIVADYGLDPDVEFLNVLVRLSQAVYGPKKSHPEG